VTTYDPPDRRGWVNDAPPNGRADPRVLKKPPQKSRKRNEDV
jgi:hypothetical protein